MKKTTKLLASVACTATIVLTGCSTEPKTKVIVVEPEAVIQSNVYVRYPKSAYEKLQMGGAAWRLNSFEYTLNDSQVPFEDIRPCEPCEPQQVKQVIQKPKQVVKKTTKTKVKARAASGTNKSIYRTRKAAKKTTLKIDCNLYRTLCEKPAGVSTTQDTARKAAEALQGVSNRVVEVNLAK